MMLVNSFVIGFLREWNFSVQRQAIVRIEYE